MDQTSDTPPASPWGRPSTPASLDWARHGHVETSEELTSVFRATPRAGAVAGTATTRRWARRVSPGARRTAGTVVLAVVALGSAGSALALHDALFPAVGNDTTRSVWQNPGVPSPTVPSPTVVAETTPTTAADTVETDTSLDTGTSAETSTPADTATTGPSLSSTGSAPSATTPSSGTSPSGTTPSSGTISSGTTPSGTTPSSGSTSSTGTAPSGTIDDDDDADDADDDDDDDDSSGRGRGGDDPDDPDDD